METRSLLKCPLVSLTTSFSRFLPNSERTRGRGEERKRTRELQGFRVLFGSQGTNDSLLCFLEPILHHWIMGLMMIMDMQRVLIE